MKASEHKAGLFRVAELRPDAEALHDSDLHETAAAKTDLGTMAFCPGCEAHIILHGARDQVHDPRFATPEAYVAAQTAKLARLDTLLGKTIVADDLRRPVPPSPVGRP